MKYFKFFILSLLISANLLASLDIADLYLRKINGIEFTFLGEDGWSQNKKNKFEFFYETDYLMNAGTNNPNLIKANDDTDKNPLAVADWGFFLDITSKKNPLDIIFFNFSSKTMMVNPDHENFYLSTVALAFPEFVSFEDSYIRQSITGISVNYNNYVSLSYGVILDERNGKDLYNGFYELNIPFFQNSFVRNINENKIERYEGSFHYDKYNSKLGFRYKNTINTRKHYYIESNVYQDDTSYINLGAMVNNEFNLASLKSSFVLHSSKEKMTKNKFGYAYFLTASLFLTNPQKSNIWGENFGKDELYKGGKLEFSFQAPLLAWAGFFYVVFVGPFSLLADDADAVESVFVVGGAMIEASDESDTTYGIFSIGFDYNNPDLLDELPDATDYWHIYAKFRIVY